MVDRTSRPDHSPNRTPSRIERRIIKVRVLRRWGPARIGYLLGIHPSTVHRVLTRYGLAKLRWLDRATGHVIRRIESARPGDLVHVDVKKLGKIPVGGGWRMLGRTLGNHNTRADKSSGRRSRHGDPLHGHHFLHTALDGHSRLAYSELLSRRAQGDSGSILGPSQCLVHPVRCLGAKSSDRQRILLSLPHLPRGSRRDRTSSNPTLSATDQRKSGAISPHPGRRMGLRTALYQRC